MPSSSSDPKLSAMLMMGATSPNPQVVADFRVGDNSSGADGLAEYLIGDGGGGHAARGHLTWDPGHGPGGTEPFFSVAPVRLDVSPAGCRWSVGTTDYIGFEAVPYKTIEKVQVVARSANKSQQRLLQWDALEVTVSYADGRLDVYQPPCLPRVSDARQLRRGAYAPAGAPGGAGEDGAAALQQFTEICMHGGDVVGLKVRGQVTLRANHTRAGASPLGPDDLQGRILVFTDAARPAADASAWA